MKLISLWEPWATLMAIGAKTVETRSWGTSYRGWLAIHASKGGISKKELGEYLAEEEFSKALGETPLSPGNIVAVVRLIDCLPTKGTRSTDMSAGNSPERPFGNYDPGRFGWITDRRFRLPIPIPFKAKQGLCSVPDQIVGQIQEEFRSDRELRIIREIVAEARA